MTKKFTTSDKLKLLFKAALDGDAKDWKRTGKFKNDAGQEVRTFENKKTGDELTVTDTGDGRFHLAGNNFEMTASVPDAFAEAAQKAPADAPFTSLSATVHETDAAKNAAADRIVELLLMDEYGPAEADDLDESGYGVKQELVDAAGRALANRYCFAIMDMDDELTAMITPVAFYEQRGYCDDRTGPIHDLLPGCADVMESTWEFCDPKVKTPVDAAKYLQELGFVWDRDFQNFVDASQTAALEKHVAPRVKDEPAPKKPGGPSPAP